MCIPFHFWKHFQQCDAVRSRWRLIHWVDRQAWRARMIPLQRPNEIRYPAWWTVDLPNKNGDLPNKNGDLPNKNGDLP